MTALVFIGLAAVWAVVLVPGWVRSFRERNGRRTSIDAFNDQLSVLGSGAGVPGATPPGARLRPLDQMQSGRRPRSSFPTSVEDARQRRRDVTIILASAAIVTLLLWIPTAIALLLVLHIVFDVALAGFIGLTVQRRRVEAERLAKVHYLQPNAGNTGDVTSRLARRSAN